MRQPVRILMALAALSIFSHAARAADELFPIKLYQADKVGSLQDVHFTFEQRTETTMAAPFHDPQTSSALLQADLTGRMETTQINKEGQPTAMTLTIAKMTRPNGKDMIPPGTILDIHRTPVDYIYKPRDGGLLSDEAVSVLKLLLPGLPKAGIADQAYGSQIARKAGETWAVNPAQTAQLLSSDPVVIAPKDVHGQTTIKGVETPHGTRALRLLTTVSADNIDINKVPAGEQFNGGELKLTQGLLQPVDTTLPPLELTSTLDLSMRLYIPTRQIAVERKVHLAMTFSGTLVDNPDPAKTPSTK